VRELLATLSEETVALLEIAHELGDEPKQVAEKSAATWTQLQL